MVLMIPRGDDQRHGAMSGGGEAPKRQQRLRPGLGCIQKPENGDQRHQSAQPAAAGQDVKDIIGAVRRPQPALSASMRVQSA